LARFAPDQGFGSGDNVDVRAAGAQQPRGYARVELFVCGFERSSDDCNSPREPLMECCQGMSGGEGATRADGTQGI
jgi:hypothetical protein